MTHPAPESKADHQDRLDANPESGTARGVSWAYWSEGDFTVHIAPACEPPGGGEMWATHPWTRTDPKIETYEHCPRCGSKRLAIPAALARIKPRPAPRRLWQGFDRDGNPIPL